MQIASTALRLRLIGAVAIAILATSVVFVGALLTGEALVPQKPRRTAAPIFSKVGLAS